MGIKVLGIEEGRGRSLRGEELGCLGGRVLGLLSGRGFGS